MLAALASVPSGVGSFVNTRRKTLGWTAGTIGGAYMLSKWTVRKFGEVADKSRRQTIDRDNLTRRFHLNQQDCQFTVLALLPTVSTQILSEMDVEGYSAQLARASARAKAKEREMAEQAEREQQAAQRATEEAERERLAESVAATPPEAQAGLATTEDAAAPLAAGEASGPETEEVDTSANQSVKVPTSTPASLPAAVNEHVHPESSVSPKSDAPAPDISPMPEAGTESQPSPAEKADASAATGIEHMSASMMDSQIVAEATGGVDTQADASPHSADSSLGKSWAQVVADGNGNAEVSEPAPAAETAAPERPRAELWQDIKIQSFARTITSLYVLTLLTLQTHVQLNLLGRASYVTSVMSSLPADSSSSESLSMDPSTDRDLEMALYAEKAPGARSVGVSKDTERRYLTFSWWLLHRGWKIVADRVQRAVEEVVSPMGLKSNIVYGELSTLFSQIRQKIDLDDDGSLYTFTAALFPSCADDEYETLSQGGIPESDLAYPVPAELRRLLNETVDCLEAPDCVLVRKLCLDRLFSQLVLGLEGPFRPRENVHRGSRFEDVTERTTRLASLLPAVARQSHLVLNGMPNEFVEALEDVRELNEFSAILYSSFDRDNVRGSC